LFRILRAQDDDVDQLKGHGFTVPDDFLLPRIRKSIPGDC